MRVVPLYRRVGAHCGAPNPSTFGLDPRTASDHARFQDEWEQLQRFSGLSPRSQGQSLALTVLYVPHSIDSGLRVQGYLAHKKQPPLLGPPWDPRYSPTVGSWWIAVSYERGTPVVASRGIPATVRGLGAVSLQGYLAYKKPHVPRTLPSACA